MMMMMIWVSSKSNVWTFFEERVGHSCTSLTQLLHNVYKTVKTRVKTSVNDPYEILVSWITNIVFLKEVHRSVIVVYLIYINLSNSEPVLFSVVDDEFLFVNGEEEAIQWPLTYTIKATKMSLTTNLVEDFISWSVFISVLLMGMLP